MKVTLYRYEKGTLVMRSVEMEKLQAALRTENLNKPISTTRDKVMFALPGTQNSDIQKLPVVVFGGTFRGADDGCNIVTEADEGFVREGLKAL